jgi:pentapeptide repeat protein
VDQQRQSRWQLTRRQVLWTAGIVVALVVLIRIGYALPWTGFGQAEVAQHVRTAKTLWDWLKLLIVPAVLGLAGYFVASLFTRAQNRAALEAEERRAQNEALQAYLDNMSGMLIPSNEQPSLYDDPVPDSLRTVARARTLTVLPRLGGDRKARVVQFLYESGLITKDKVIVDLLKGANLHGANLGEAQLSYANLSKADSQGARLIKADLSHADLGDAKLSLADLGDAKLSKANLRGAGLSGADLSGADLSGATGWTEEQLDLAKSLKGATMPDGQKYEDWLESKANAEEGKNSDPS